MEKTILNVLERSVKPKKIKENGVVAGVIYGDDVKKATSVKFKETELKNAIAKHGFNAKVWIKCGETNRFGFIKDIQRHPVSAKIIHVDVQLVSKNHEIKLQLPIEFKGEEELAPNMLKLQIHKPDIDILGKINLMPDVAIVDVSKKKLGDTITINDFALDKQLKITDNEDEIYAAIVHLNEQVDDEENESDTAK